eukprot:TRINITY_DN5433_c0_g3_i1.p1 TRINITY_DN5433_c0_g3~~TRINITY_DN5433_c0_g3_i1.p1  ORF type:complete len:513 (-),score=80.99 TRINITY_DN5433_c0_g3_i1:165-1703(-)
MSMTEKAREVVLPAMSECSTQVGDDSPGSMSLPIDPVDATPGRYPKGKTLWRSPVWYALAVMACDFVPKVMTLVPQVVLCTDQFGEHAYWYNTASQVLQSLLSAPAIAYAGYLSQPHRWGRKAVAMYLVLMSSISMGVLLVTEDAYTILGFQLLLAILGAPSMNLGLITVMTAWVTDWCKAEDKLKYFAVLQGSLFGMMAVAPMVTNAIRQTTDLHGLFFAANLLKLSGPFFLVFLFPSFGSLEPLTPASLRRMFTASNLDNIPEGDEEAAPSTTKKTMREVVRALKHLYDHHFWETGVYLILNFSDMAVQDIIATFLQKERGMTEAQLGGVIALMGACGFFFQTIGVPVAARFDVNMKALLTVSTVATILHFLSYAVFTQASWLVASTPLGSFGAVALIAAQTLISGVDKEGRHKDQGTLFGTLSGLRMVASCTGPIITAALASNWQTFDPPFNFAGISFAVLVVVTLPALAMALVLQCDRRRTEAFDSSFLTEANERNADSGVSLQGSRV